MSQSGWASTAAGSGAFPQGARPVVPVVERDKRKELHVPPQRKAVKAPTASGAGIICPSDISCKLLIGCLAKIGCSALISCRSKIFCSPAVTCGSKIACGARIVPCKLKIAVCTARIGPGCPVIDPIDVTDIGDIFERCGVRDIVELAAKVDTAAVKKVLAKLNPANRKALTLMLRQINKK